MGSMARARIADLVRAPMAWVIAQMNDSDFRPAASLRAADTARAETIGAQVDAVFMNRADCLAPARCWTGRKDTGRGGELSVAGYHNLTRPRSCHLRKLK